MICIYVNIRSVKRWDCEDDNTAFCLFFPPSFFLPSQMVSVDHLLEKPFIITFHESSSDIL